MKTKICAAIFLLICTSSLTGQTPVSNPFELKHRLTRTENLDSPQPRSTQVDSVADNNNPFDIQKGRRTASVSTAENIIDQNQQPAVAAPDKQRITNNSIFWILIFLTLLFGVIINLNRSILTNLVKAWSNQNFGNMLLRDKKSQDQVLYSLLAFIFYINAGLFIGLALERFSGVVLTFKMFSFLVLIILGVYLIRHLTLYFLASIFSIGKEARQYSFTIHLFNILSGLFLLVVNYLIAFSPSAVGIVMIYIAIILLAIQFIYRNIRALLLGTSYIGSDKLHFFLYLCSCEIAPWVLGYIALTRMA